MKISIITVTKNRVELLRRAIGSVIDQTYNDWEYIIVNDASTDNTKQIIEGFDWAHERIKAIHYDKGSQGALGVLRNLGISHATGDLICFLDDDNYYNSNFLSRMNKYMEENKEIDMIYCDSNFLLQKSDNTFVTQGCLRSMDYNSNTINHGNYIDIGEVCIRKKVFDKLKFDETLFSAGEDWEFFLQMKKNKMNIKHLREVLTNYSVMENRHSIGDAHFKVIQEIKNRVGDGQYD